MALPGDAVAASAPRGARHVDRRRPPGRAAAAPWRAASAPRTSGRPAPAATSIARSRARAFARALGSCSSTRSPTRSAAAAASARSPRTRCRCRRTTGATGRRPRARRRRRSTANSPLIALVDAQLDRSHPSGGRQHRHDRAVPGHQRARHGDRLGGGGAGQRARHRRRLAGRARAQRPAAGARSRARSSADQIAEAIERGAAVINMSYGASASCFPEYLALQVAVASGIVPVAAAGNEFAEGNPLEFPASLPHVAHRRRGRAAAGLPELVLLQRQRRDRPLGARRERS